VDAPCLVTLRDASVDDAVNLMRRGAFSVVSLPVDPEKFAFQVEQALRHRELCEKNASLEKSLETHERLAMIGKLAAGVAHELNNPLDGVLRFVNLTIDGLPKDSQQIPYLLEARRGLRRMADIVRDLLQFSRNANVDATHEDAERLARDAVAQVVAGVQHRKVETTFDFPPVGVPLPRGMFQVFGNLAKNASDAMPQGGTLSCAARIANGRVLIRVTDTGTGIPEEIRDRVFEPFFTTKEVGKGTGLGLPICQRIVERLGGTLTIESEVGRGTTVIVDLPTRRPQGPPARAVSDSPFATSRTGQE
jgi:signal transduction histidine kinase